MKKTDPHSNAHEIHTPRVHESRYANFHSNTHENHTPLVHKSRYTSFYSRRFIFPVLLLFWLFCIPLAFSIYTPVLYKANCYWNERCEQMGETRTQQRIAELTGFFLHQSDELPSPWTGKENIHMSEVRVIYDRVFTVFVLITLLFIIDGCIVAKPVHRYSNYAKNSLLISVGLVLLALVIVPFFNVFWMKVFHPLFFDNELWRTNRSDVSWYLMPKTFFLRLIIFICCTTLIFNLLIYALGRLLRKD